MLSMAWLWSTACYDKFSDTSREHSDRQSLSTTKCPTAPATTDAEVCVLVHPKQEICDGADMDTHSGSTSLIVPPL
eukprot:m.904553 g.904553  ORF g.904553 m.904553 type:complete len:76 (-) comp23695_c0_seq33:130-357(-)